AAEQHLDRVEHHALGPHAVDRVAEADEEAAEVVLAVLLHLRPLDLDVVDDELLVADQPVEAETERADVLGQLLPALLEGHEHARLAALDGAAHEELDGQQGLAAAWAPADQRGTPGRKATAGDLVEARDAGRAFRQRACGKADELCILRHRLTGVDSTN